jgi:hypothetical protein
MRGLRALSIVVLILGTAVQALATPPDQIFKPREKRPLSVALFCRVYGLWPPEYYNFYVYNFQCRLSRNAPTPEAAPLVCWCSPPRWVPSGAIMRGYKAVYDPRLDLIGDGGKLIKKGTQGGP